MKQCKTLLSIVMAIMMLLTMMIPTLAVSGTNDDTGKITIDNAVVGQKYSVYQLLVLESFDTGTGTYAYKANSTWETWLKTQTTYLAFDPQGYVTWVEGADVAAFAKAAEAYAKEHPIVTTNGPTEAETTTVEFTGLNLGYYLVTTTLGTLCSLDTTNKEVTIKEKNVEPTNVKKVEEDSTGEYDSTNDADIGQTVNFQSIITAQAGAENYVFHDKMSTGLTYGSVAGITLNNVAVDSKYYTVNRSDLTDGCTFEVVFTQEFCDTLKANDKIVISYTATLNANAVVGLPGNPNESKVEYGEKVILLQLLQALLLPTLGIWTF